MSYPRDLLDQARHLANKEPRKPKQASLRRAVSDAYYSLFHLLIEEAAKMLVADKDLRKLVQRCFLHGEMKEACRPFASKNLPDQFKSFDPVPNDLSMVAAAFIELQEARHDADYNLAKSLTRTEANELIERMERAFVSWGNTKNHPLAQVYLASLLLVKKWKST